MIFYFSATGNTQRVAERIAEQTGDEMVAMPACLDAGTLDFDLASGTLWIVTPVYFWSLPTVVEDFLSKATFADVGHAFVVCTYGVTAGYSAGYVQEILGRKGIALDGAFGVKGPDTATFLFDLSDEQKVRTKVDGAEADIARLMTDIDEHATGNRIRNTTPKFAADIARLFYATMRQTSFFTVGETCIGCGRCAELCPVYAIELRDGRPVWVVEDCSLCLGCLHRCPKFAIQYGRQTHKHGQYRNPYAGEVDAGAARAGAGVTGTGAETTGAGTDAAGADAGTAGAGAGTTTPR